MKPIALMALTLAVLAGSAAADSGELTLERARVWHDGAIRLTARFDPNDVPEDFDVREDGFSVAYGGFPFVTATNERGLFTPKAGLRTKYRERGDFPCHACLDLGQGTLTVSAKDIVWPHSLLPLAFEFTLTLGEVRLTGKAEPLTKKRFLDYRGTKAPRPGRSLPFRTAMESIGGDETKGGIVVYRDQASFWALYGYEPGRVPIQAPPEVDFATEMAVLLKLGSRPSGGYYVEPLRVRERGDGLSVVYREGRPGPACIVTAAVTSPWTLLVVPRREGRVTGRVKVKIHDCR